ncbi:transmembrane protein 255B [Phoca vitulina]|uniref:transmembrane protein 255B n=2 Tax=Phocinae TaxID=3410118 RepID=UPI001395F4ED|nr:transmembrane protein 255B [Phoca vitulina]
MRPPVPGPLALLDTTEGFARRKKTSLWFVGSLLVMSASILTIGLAATTRTENVTVGGYYPGIILGFGAFLGIIGINLVENRRQMLVAAIVFISFGVVAAFCCAVVDGVFAARHIVTCHPSSGPCQLKVKSSTCYCCELYSCWSTEPPLTYYEFVGVRGCQDVLHLYRLLWASAVLNVLGVLLGILTAAVLGAFKDMVPPSQLAYGPSAPPQILYNPAQQVLAYAGFCPAPATLPTCSSHPLPLQVGPASPRGAGALPPWVAVAQDSPGQTGHEWGLRWREWGTQFSYKLPEPAWRGSWGQCEGSLADDSRPLHISGLLCSMWPWRPGLWCRPDLAPFLTQARVPQKFPSESRPAAWGL